MRLTHLLVLGALVASTLLAAPRSASAQGPIDSTTALKEACEAAFNNFLYVTTDVKITKGPHEDVASPCSVSLGPSASFEADGVSMRFAGGFRLDSSRERSATFTRSVWEASSLELYGGEVTTFKSVGSLLRATSGDMKISSGSESAIQLQGSDLEAGAVVISGGNKVVVTVSDTGIEGMNGVQIQLGARDGVLKAENTEVASPRGSITVTGVVKTVVELKRVTLASGAGDTRVSLALGESQLKAELTRISSQGGSVHLSAGDGGGWASGVELVETTVDATNGVRVAGSWGEGPYDDGRFGTVKVSKSAFSAGSDIVFRSSEFGTTEVKESSISSGSAIRILTGTNGTCTADKNEYRAPVQQICP